jgi:ABC-type phosphate transport system auxiliary subunit
MSGQADQWIKSTTIGCVALLALIAGTVSYLHMHLLVALHGQPGWVAALTPLSVDGMIVAASTTLLADSRSGRRGGVLPWALLVAGSVASLAANVAVAEPTVIGRVIAAWPSFALTASYELLTRQVRASTIGRHGHTGSARASRGSRRAGPAAGADNPAPVPGLALVRATSATERVGGRELQRQAWQWALAHRAGDGSLPSGKTIADRYDRHERWGRLVKRAGTAGELDQGGRSSGEQAGP